MTLQITEEFSRRSLREKLTLSLDHVFKAVMHIAFFSSGIQ
jgi:hypothetical protein